MDVNALHKDELEFELACRGILDCKTVATMRKFLREILVRELSGESSISFKVPKSCIDNPGNEILVCVNKLSAITSLISEVSQSPESSFIRRIHSRLTHLSNRAKLIIPTEAGDIEKHLSLLKNVQDTLLSLKKLEQEGEEDEEDDVISEHEKDILQKSLGEEAVQIIGQLEKYQNPGKAFLPNDTMSEVPQNRASRSTADQAVLERPREPTHHPYLQRASTFDSGLHKRKLVPIKDWGVKFTGKGSVSVNAFLERVEELKDARNATDEDLFRYAIDFFEDEALVWFRANKGIVDDWSQLVTLLLDTFQHPYYQEELLEEIKRRTQSCQESVMVYMAIMQNMFIRLPTPIPEGQKLLILRRNLQPYLQQAICRDIFDSVREMTSVLRIIERTKLSCDNFKEPTLNKHSLEGDLAYQGNTSRCSGNENRSELAAINDKEVVLTKCWNCRATGHRFRDCTLPKQRLFCYRCGRFGRTTSKCSCNATNKGNDSSESMPADRTPRN
ncbi:hypothetical protein PYW08_005910 [Mythimna loreyi]|uniref:Uncharacterized protein n=1 Tax=Mythimna loreyi TaxID=667449 RepID=A0ACC2QID8_9NEOP|nr:hypothetical protein PYW08_005910 [Mythimna loreyi]